MFVPDDVEITHAVDHLRIRGAEHSVKRFIRILAVVMIVSSPFQVNFGEPSHLLSSRPELSWLRQTVDVLRWVFAASNLWWGIYLWRQAPVIAADRSRRRAGGSKMVPGELEKPRPTG
jgi:hypothetical protein